MKNVCQCAWKSELKSKWLSKIIVGLIVPSPIQNLILVHLLLIRSSYWNGFSVQQWSVNVLVKWNVHVCEGLVENRIFYPQTAGVEEFSAMAFFWNVKKKCQYFIYFTKKTNLPMFTDISCLDVSSVSISHCFLCTVEFQQRNDLVLCLFCVVLVYM